MKVSDILAFLKTDGWFLVATRGSHRQLKHTVKSGVLQSLESQAMI